MHSNNYTCTLLGMCEREETMEITSHPIQPQDSTPA